MTEKIGWIPFTIENRTVRSYVSQLYAGSFGSAGRFGLRVATLIPGPDHQRLTRSSCVPVFLSCGNTRSGSPYSTTPSSKMPRRRDFDADAPEASNIETATARATATAAALRTRRVSLERPQSAAQPLVQLDLRLPAEDLARARDVRLAHLRVVDRQRLVEDLARRAGRREDRLRELEDRVLARVADVHRQVLAGLGEQGEAANQVVDVTEAARLGAVPVDGERLLGERLAQEVRDRAPVVRPHLRAVGVEDPHDRGVDALLAVIGHRQRLGIALRLVVHPARADRVDVPPVGLGLRVHLGVPVHLAGRGEQEPRA